MLSTESMPKKHEGARLGIGEILAAVPRDDGHSAYNCLINQCGVILAWTSAADDKELRRYPGGEHHSGKIVVIAEATNNLINVY